MLKEVTKNQLLAFATFIKSKGGRALLCGGSVRDELLKLPQKDFDVEIHELKASVVEECADKFASLLGFSVDKVGQSFTVIKVGSNLDISIPRIEKKSGTGHKAFKITGDPNLGTFEASRRRDFTCNAIMKDILTGEIIDHFGGQEDLKNGIIRVVDPKTFVEDSLRVLRAAQFAARFSFDIDETTEELCRQIDLSDLPKERIWTEMEKLLLSRDPSFGLGWLQRLGVVEKLFPQLKDKSLVRIAATLDNMKNLIFDLSKPKKICLMLVCFGLRFCTHEEFDLFLDSLNIETIDNFKVRKVAHALLEEADLPMPIPSFFKNPDRIIRVLSTEVEIDLLVRVKKAMNLVDDANWLFNNAVRLGVLHNEPEPILLGRHLLEMGFKPSPQVGKIVKEAFDKQLAGEITTLEQAKEFVNSVRN